MSFHFDQYIAIDSRLTVVMRSFHSSSRLDYMMAWTRSLSPFCWGHSAPLWSNRCITPWMAPADSSGLPETFFKTVSISCEMANCHILVNIYYYPNLIQKRSLPGCFLVPFIKKVIKTQLPFDCLTLMHAHTFPPFFLLLNIAQSQMLWFHAKKTKANTNSSQTIKV